MPCCHLTFSNATFAALVTTLSNMQLNCRDCRIMQHYVLILLVHDNFVIKFVNRWRHFTWYEKKIWLLWTLKLSKNSKRKSLNKLSSSNNLNTENLLKVPMKAIKSYSWQVTRNVPLEIFLHSQIYYNHDRSQCLQLLRWLLTKCTCFEVKRLSCFT